MRTHNQSLIESAKKWIDIRRDRRLVAFAIVGPAADRGRIQSAIEAAGFRPIITGSWDQAIAQLPRSHPPVVLYDASRTDRPWREALDTLQDAPRNPSVILLTEWIAKPLGRQPQDWGCYDILGPAPTLREMESSIRIAFVLWSNQRALRKALFG